MKNALYISLLATLLAQTSFAMDTVSMAKTYKCTFDNGISSQAEKDGFSSEKVSDRLEMTFDSIDYNKHSARLIGSIGAEDVSVIHAKNILSFIEITPSGNVNLTSIYSQKIDGLNLAITSRHVTVASNPIPSQHYGKCQVLD